MRFYLSVFLLIFVSGSSYGQSDTVKTFMALAEAGGAEYQWALATSYRKGIGVPQNYRMAVKWYTKAAEQGFAEAQSQLCIMYHYGTGVRSSNVKAYMWCNLAVFNGNEDIVDLRMILADFLTTEQIAEAQDLSAQCLANSYKDC